ncbi:RNA methyltransferase [Bacteriovoracaceae bacterium]|nr:RNA methyltransferase [Bacteriovoracaceae bacterium]
MLADNKTPPVYLGLVHHPVYNKTGDVITTSVTNMDLHDISRTCRTFGIKRYFIVTPIVHQHDLLENILGYWETDSANCYNPDRHDALSLIKVSNDIEMMIAEIEKEEGVPPFVAVTSAKEFQKCTMDFFPIIQKMRLDRRPLLLLFGTGHGLTEEVIENADFFVKPIVGVANDSYNHLSVRSAVAIYCDRMSLSLEGVQ